MFSIMYITVESVVGSHKTQSLMGGHMVILQIQINLLWAASCLNPCPAGPYIEGFKHVLDQ